MGLVLFAGQGSPCQRRPNINCLQILSYIIKYNEVVLVTFSCDIRASYYRTDQTFVSFTTPFFVLLSLKIIAIDCAIFFTFFSSVSLSTFNYNDEIKYIILERTSHYICSEVRYLLSICSFYDNFDSSLHNFTHNH